MNFWLVCEPEIIYELFYEPGVICELLAILGGNLFFFFFFALQCPTNPEIHLFIMCRLVFGK